MDAVDGHACDKSRFHEKLANDNYYH